MKTLLFLFLLLTFSLPPRAEDSRIQAHALAAHPDFPLSVRIPFQWIAREERLRVGQYHLWRLGPRVAFDRRIDAPRIEFTLKKIPESTESVEFPSYLVNQEIDFSGQTLQAILIDQKELIAQFQQGPFYIGINAWVYSDKDLDLVRSILKTATLSEELDITAPAL